MIRMFSNHLAAKRSRARTRSICGIFSQEGTLLSNHFQCFSSYYGSMAPCGVVELELKLVGARCWWLELELS